MSKICKIKPLKLSIDTPQYDQENSESESFSLSGVSYSGGLILNHSGFPNLIIDTADLKIEKEQTPIYFNHDSSKIIGFSEISVEDNKIKISGIISKSVDEGKRIFALKDLGFNWEMSVGIYPAEISFSREGDVVNGIEVPNGTAIFGKNTLFEVSIVDIGADRNTETKIFSKERDVIILGEETMDKIINEENKELFVFSCDLLKGTVKEIEDKIQDSEIDLAKFKAELEEKDAEIAKIAAELASIKEESAEKEIANNAAEIVAQLKADHISVDSSVITLLLKSNMAKEEILGKFSVEKEPVSTAKDYLTSETVVPKELPLEVDLEKFKSLDSHGQYVFTNELANSRKITFEQAQEIIFSK